MDHKRIIVIGRSGSGKSVMMRALGLKAPKALYINTQRNQMAAPWKELKPGEGWAKELETLNHVYMNPEKDWDIEAFVQNFYRYGQTNPGRTLLIDEITFWGMRGKLSAPPWMLTAVTRARTTMHTILSAHSCHQIGNVYLANCDAIVFFNSGQSMEAERDYLQKYYAPLTTPKLRKWLETPYHYVLYDVKSDQYYPRPPVPYC